MIDSAILERYSNLPKKEMWINEAKFGFGHLEPYLDRLGAGNKVLEVGSGSGILLSLVQSAYPHLSFQGIEPLGDGFESLRQYHRTLEKDGIRLHNCGYEDFQSTDQYDLIFLVNVFEHLPDWIDFLQFVKARLSESGNCLILCPNYGFPYESHFGIPIILNKTMTYRVFKKRIVQFEAEHDCDGLWRSLNFIKHSSLKAECARLGLAHKFHTDIIVNMIERLDADPEFQKRQKKLYRLSRLAKKSGVHHLLKLPMVQNIAPYMKIELSRLKH